MSTDSNRSVLSLLPLFFVLIIEAMGFGIVFPLMGPLFLVSGQGLLESHLSMGIRELFYGLSITSFFIFILVGSPFIGDLSDKLGRKKVLLLCLFVTSFAYFLCAVSIWVSNVYLFLAARCLAGFVAASQSIAQAAIIDISTPETKVKNLAFMTLAGCLGFAVGPLVGGVFSSSEYFSWVDDTTPFMIAAILAFFNALSLIVLFKETHVVLHRSTIRLTKVFDMLKDAWLDIQVRKVAFLFLLMQLGWGLFYQYASFYLVQYFHYNGMKIGLFNTFIGILFSLTLVFLIRWFLKFIGLHTLTFLMLFLQGLSTILVAVFTDEASMWTLLVPTTLAVGLSYTCLLTLFSEVASPERQGWVMGVSEAVMSIAWSIGSLFTACISLFPPGSLFWIAGILPLTGFFLFGKTKNLGHHTIVESDIVSS